jgi:hypothetical protein
LRRGVPVFDLKHPLCSFPLLPSRPCHVAACRPPTAYRATRSHVDAHLLARPRESSCCPDREVSTELAIPILNRAVSLPFPSFVSPSPSSPRLGVKFPAIVASLINSSCPQFRNPLAHLLRLLAPALTTGAPGVPPSSSATVRAPPSALSSPPVLHGLSPSSSLTVLNSTLCPSPHQLLVLISTAQDELERHRHREFPSSPPSPTSTAHLGCVPMATSCRLLALVFLHRDSSRYRALAAETSLRRRAPPGHAAMAVEE